jgi:hypothetical protein
MYEKDRQIFDNISKAINVSMNVVGLTKVRKVRENGHDYLKRKFKLDKAQKLTNQKKKGL